MQSGILSHIGHTPFVFLERLYREIPVKIYAKLEMFNPGGSTKDRPAAYMVQQAIEKGEVTSGTTIIESSSGNMAIGLAQVCLYHNLDLIIVVDPKINKHTLGILKTYGAQIEQVTEADGSGNYLGTRIRRVQKLLETIPDSYWPNQYANSANPAAHEQTMREIVQSMPAPPDYLLTATSTCGTVMGCANFVHQQGLPTKIVAVDAVGSVLFGLESDDRLVPGHGAGRPSDLLDEQAIDHIVHISDEECVSGCHRLLQREAILAGGSSGAVVTAVKKMENEMPAGSSCALIFPDSGERYLDTIYDQEWLGQHFGERKVEHLLRQDALPVNKKRVPIPAAYPESGKNKTKKIAIVGGGPKGMYGFERLAAQFKEKGTAGPVEVHVYDKCSHFGAGRIYHPHQPEYLLMNNHAGDINMWIDEKPGPVVPDPLSLKAWARQKKGISISENDYVGRSLVGAYLHDGFMNIVSCLPPYVRARFFVSEVTDIKKEGDQYTLQVTNGRAPAQTIPHRYDHVLLATGHPQNKLSEQDQKVRDFSRRHKNTGFIPFVYPVELMDEAEAGSRVAVKGMGLTFVDVVLALTQGRGGLFKRDGESGSLVYEPSGQEPAAIYPLSRGGWPMIPRQHTSTPGSPLTFFTRKAVEKMKKSADTGKLNFKEQIRPLLFQEMKYAYYEVAFRKSGFKNDLETCASFAEVGHYIDLYHRENPGALRFEPACFLHPESDPQFQNEDTHHHRVQSYLNFFIEEAKKGETESPWAAVTAVWRKMTPLFGEIYALGGLTPDSQRYFDTVFRRLLNRVTFGPPVTNMEKILALANCGMLDFRYAVNPDIDMQEEKGIFELRSGDEKNAAQFEYLVDARISKISVEDDRSPLYQNLLGRGLVTLFENKKDTETYRPGCIALSAEGAAVDASGNPVKGITVTGTPTEGVFFDNDALARSRNNVVSQWAGAIGESCSALTPTRIIS